MDTLGYLTGYRPAALDQVRELIAQNKLAIVTVAQEMAHLKETSHNTSFYQLCNHITPNYHQVEFDLRLYLTQLALSADR